MLSDVDVEVVHAVHRGDDQHPVLGNDAVQVLQKCEEVTCGWKNTAGTLSPYFSPPPSTVRWTLEEIPGTL